MCGYLSQALERAKHMSRNMVTGKPSTWVKPGADFVPHSSWDWVSHASYGGYKCGHCTSAAGVSGALYAKAVSPSRERGIEGTVDVGGLGLPKVLKNMIWQCFPSEICEQVSSESGYGYTSVWSRRSLGGMEGDHDEG
jgi:hypothetical protein